MADDLAARQSLVQIVDDVLDIFYTDGKPDTAVRDAHALALGLCQVAM